MLFDAAWLNTQDYKLRINSKWSNPGKGVEAFLAVVDI